MPIPKAFGAAFAKLCIAVLLVTAVTGLSLGICWLNHSCGALNIPGALLLAAGAFSGVTLLRILMEYPANRKSS